MFTTSSITTQTISNSLSQPISSRRISTDKMATKEAPDSSRCMASGAAMNEPVIGQPSAPSPHSVCGGGVDIDLRGIPRFILDLQQIQPTLNIMTCGDVSHGKSTLLKALSGESTGKDSREKRRNMTIRLGYTACKIWKCLLCPMPRCYFSTHSDLSTKKVRCGHCGATPDQTHKEYGDGTSNVILLRHLSFVDVPGHSELMQTMVSATSVADAAILVVDASKSCPGKQTEQHLEAVHLLGLMRRRQLIVAQNKVDLTDRKRACLSHEEIRRFVASFGDENAPIIPISAQSQLNIDALCHCIVHSLPRYSPKLTRCDVPRSLSFDEEEKREIDPSSFCKPSTASDPANDRGDGRLRANIIRSFDVNKAGDISSVEDIDKIVGGVLGGAVLSGRIEIGQTIEIRPGYIIKKKRAKQRNAVMDRLQPQWDAQPIRTVVRSLQYGRTRARSGFSGGNVGIETNVDPSLTKSDGLCGHVIVDGDDPNPPPIFNKFKMSYHFLMGNRRQNAFKCNGKQFESIRLNIGAFKMRAEVVRVGVGDYDGILCVVEAPICGRVGDKVGICRQNKQREWAFVGGGIIRETKTMRIAADRQKMESKNGPKMGTTTGSSIERMQQKEHSMVHIRYQQRNGRKGMTTVTGLPNNVRFKKLLKSMKKQWSTGATIIDDKERGTIILLQGDLRGLVKPFLLKLNIANGSQFRSH